MSVEPAIDQGRRSGTTTLCKDSPLNNFDLIRIVMALAVVWSHSFWIAFGSEQDEPISLLTGGVINSGEIGVDVFFIISGFLIARSFEKSKSILAYLMKRVRRIYPGYLVATSIGAFVVIPLVTGISPRATDVIKTLLNNLFLRNWSVAPGPFVDNPLPWLNASLWSIPYEYLCYLGVVVVGVIGSRRLLVGLLLAIMGVQTYVNLSGIAVYSDGLAARLLGSPDLWLSMAPMFITGALAWQYRDKLPRSRWLLTLAVAAVVAGSRLAPIMVATPMPIFLGYVLFHVAFPSGAGHVPAAKYGDFSYGTYLYGMPIQQLLLAYVPLPFPMFVLASLILSLLAGVISWYTVERFFLRGIRLRPAAVPA